MNVDHHSLGIDIGYLQVEGFLESESAGIDRGQVGVVVKGMDPGQNPVDFLSGQDTGQPFFSFCPKIGKDMPVLFKDIDKEELNPAVGYA